MLEVDQHTLYQNIDKLKGIINPPPCSFIVFSSFLVF
jgi:hypothetical protein